MSPTTSMDAYIILYYLLIIPLLSSTALADCPISYCGMKSFNIRFPFELTNKQQDNCGFPGFNLSCVSPTLLIHLPRYGNFAVRSIDYLSQAIQIYDPSNCLPARLVRFDLSSSPFSGSYFQKYTLLSCPRYNLRFSGFKPIDCLSDSSFSTLATASESVVKSLTSIRTGCVITRRLRVPLMVDRLDQSELTSQLENITLTWRTPDCKSCELVGESCGYANSTNRTIKNCSYNNRGGVVIQNEKQGGDESSNVLRYLAFSIAILAMAASVAVACFMCRKNRDDELMSMQRTNVPNTNVVTPHGMITQSAIVGLDTATIESYTKVILGESKRLPGLDEAACPICLSEYHVKENVRCIPECRHCFHAECLDEWLKMNGTCPVCRNSPS